MRAGLQADSHKPRPSSAILKVNALCCRERRYLLGPLFPTRQVSMKA